MEQTKAPANTKAENPLLNIVFNVLLPYLILTKLPTYLPHEWGAKAALGIGLSLPISYGLWDYFVRGRRNWISVIGVFNTGLTGALAINHLSGIWYVIKEAMVPFVLGLAVYISSFSTRPFISVFVENLLKLEILQPRLASLGRESQYLQHLRKTNMFLSISFFVSAVGNLILAQTIFLPIDSALPLNEQELILNKQIGLMTGRAYLMISVPLIGFMFFVIRYLLNGIEKISELSAEELFGDKPKAPKPPIAES